MVVALEMQLKCCKVVFFSAITAWAKENQCYRWGFVIGPLWEVCEVQGTEICPNGDPWCSHPQQALNNKDSYNTCNNYDDTHNDATAHDDKPVTQWQWKCLQQLEVMMAAMAGSGVWREYI